MISGGRLIGDLNLCDNVESWEQEYKRIINPKYAKGTRNFNPTITGRKWENPEQPPIYVIPRVRAGPSYKSVVLDGVTSEDVAYMPISKGFPMQDVSSFTMGPIVGEGLCLVNAAFSKSVTVMHIEGGGKVNLKRKTFWQKTRAPHRNVSVIDDNNIRVDSIKYNTYEWLRDNEHLWLAEWDKWRKCVAMCSLGNFHWTDDSVTIAYRYKEKYLDFVRWKKECYIRPSYELLPEIPTYKFLQAIWQEHRRPLGLVHPKGISGQAEQAITKEYIRNMYDSDVEMVCQPYVIAGKLLGVDIDEVMK